MVRPCAGLGVRGRAAGRPQAGHLCQSSFPRPCGGFHPGGSAPCLERRGEARGHHNRGIVDKLPLTSMMKVTFLASTHGGPQPQPCKVQGHLCIWHVIKTQ